MDQHQTWVTVTFLKDYSAVGEDTQYYKKGRALKDPIEHPYPLAFKAGDQFHCGVCDVGEGVFSLEIEDIGKYGTVWFHGVPTAVIDFKGKPEIAGKLLPELIEEMKGNHNDFYEVVAGQALDTLFKMYGDSLNQVDLNRVIRALEDVKLTLPTNYQDAIKENPDAPKRV